MAIRKNGLGRGLGKGLDSLIQDKKNVENTGEATSDRKKTDDTQTVKTVKNDNKNKSMKNGEETVSASVKSKSKTEKNNEKNRIKSDTENVIESMIEKSALYMTENEKENSVRFMKVNDVEPNRNQPRKDFDEDSLIELADSIRQHGVLQPLLVQKKENYYEIIAGERRWRAAKLAGIREIPVLIKELSEQEVVEISLIENIQRENLNPIEEAIAFKRLMDEFHLKQDEIAERVSKSRTAVTNAMRLLKLCDKVQKMVIDDMISTGHARALLAVDDEKLQYTLAMKVFDEKLSVRETEKLVKNLKKETKKKEKVVIQNKFIYANMEERLKAIIGTKVIVNQKTDDKGKIEIEYYSKEELERIYDLITSIH